MAEILNGCRKSKVLTPSQQRCLSKVPTVNITCGCVHNCLYCYAKGYSQYPGEGRVILYANIVEKLAEELVRKVKKPRMVYFSPSCDSFQPVQAILNQTYEAMKILLENDVGVQFITKAVPPANFMDLFAEHNLLVNVQIGLTTVDDDVRKIFEPAAASVSERLSALRRLLEIGVKVSARADPLIYGVTDSNKSLTELFSAISGIGIKETAVGYLFLRPAIRENLEKGIKDRVLLRRILELYLHSEAKLLPIGMNSQGIVLPRQMWERAFDRIRSIAPDFGISIHICGCKNSDITAEHCNIVRFRQPAQLQLFD